MRKAYQQKSIGQLSRGKDHGWDATACQDGRDKKRAMEKRWAIQDGSRLTVARSEVYCARLLFRSSSTSLDSCG